jgi:peroxiredoxin
MNNIIKVIAVISLILALSALAACTATAQAQTQNLNLKQAAPDFLLKDLNGNLIALSNYRGQPIYLNYWASWCPSCVEEMPYIQAIYDDWSKRGPVMITVNAGEDLSTIQGYLQKNHYTFPVVVDPGEVAKKYNIYYIPVSVFIDKQGIIQSKQIGAFANKAAIEKQLAGIAQ